MPEIVMLTGGGPELREVLADRHRRCLPGLARMRTLARSEEGVPVAPHVAPALDLAMREVLRELGAAERALVDSLAGTPRGGSIAGLLTARLRRLSIVAEDVLAAAEAGDAPALRRRIYQFHSLATAMWQVQLGVQPKPGAHRARPMPDERGGNQGTKDEVAPFIGSAPRAWAMADGVSGKIKPSRRR